MNKSPAAEATQTPDSEIAARILTVLSDKNLTQEALAQEIGLSYSTLRRSLEQHRGDRRSFSVLELSKIADALSIHPSSLLPAALTEAA
jgi:transcriptional regulator with XRE-family HTH domain